jgi:ZIP family zinc transporter/zinc and cadmium transporter
MTPITTVILLGAAAAAANGFGGAIIVQKDWERRYLRYFVALGAGFMLSTVMLEMLPESIQLSGLNAPLLVLAGYFGVHFFEHTLTSHFHFGEETHTEEYTRPHRAYSVLFGLIIHTFFDGIAIASGFLVSQFLGWIIFLAVILHKVPEGFTASSVMLASGHRKKAAWLASAALGCATVLGVLTVTVFTRSLPQGLPLSAGVTLYVAASDLIPEVNREPGMGVALAVFLGVGLFLGIQHLFH